MSNFDIYFADHPLIRSVTRIYNKEEVVREHFFAYAYSYVTIDYDGCIIERANGQQRSIPNIFIEPARAEHLFYSKPRDSLYLVISLQSDSFHQLTGLPADRYSFKMLPCSYFLSEEKLNRLFQDLLQEQSAEESYQKIIQTLSTELEQWELQPRRMQPLLQYIDMNHKTVSVADLLEKFPYSSSSLNRMFKTMIGMSPSVYLRLFKFSHFVVRLSLFDTTLTNIALEYNYFDLSHFTRDFQLFSGIKPGEYRGPNFQLLQDILKFWRIFTVSALIYVCGFPPALLQFVFNS